MAVKVRVQAETQAEAEEAIQYLETATKGRAKFGKPREGTNPKYAGNQKWSAYGELNDHIKGRLPKGIPT